MLSIRLPQKLEERLEMIAKKEERPKSYIIRKALERYLEDLEDYSDALEILNSSSKIYTNEEATKRLGY
jgi:RHH-type transcriptional regulator, rel operon repressor / antitoxin RelB